MREYRNMPAAQKLRILAALCRDAVAQIETRQDARHLLDWQAPLPPSSVAALRRLHRQGQTAPPARFDAPR